MKGMTSVIEDRRDRMTNIVKCLDALAKVETNSICRIASTLSRIFYNLDESEGATVDESLLNELKQHVYGDLHSNIDGMAMNHLAKSFLLYLEGLLSRNVTVTVPSRNRMCYDNGEGTNRDGDTASEDLNRHDEDPSEHLLLPKVESPSEMDIIIQSVAAMSQPQFSMDDRHNQPTMCNQPTPSSSTATTSHTPTKPMWSVVEGVYICANCPRTFESQRGMLGHAKVCFKDTEFDSPNKKKRTDTFQSFDYSSRGIRSREACSCPYCDIVLSSCHMVEHHSRKEHAHERTEVYGCSECGRWCVTVMALIKHWDKHGDCPTGRLIVRKPSEGSRPKPKGEANKKAIYACGICGKGFLSRLGVKYHVVHVCLNAPIIDVLKLTSEGIEFPSTSAVVHPL